MELQLTLKGPERLFGGRRDACLREGALVIGRSAEADWPIPDPERVISKMHCRIEKDFDSFQLTDLSTNGVWVNETPVGYGLARRIENDDVIKLGDAVLTVRIVAGQPGEKPAVPDVLPPDGPFGEMAGDASAASPAPAMRQPAAETPATGVVLDDWWGPVAQRPVSARSNPVDISQEKASPAIGDVHAPEERLLSGGTSVASLPRMMADLGVEEFAQAVGRAVAALPRDERGRFEARLSEILRDARGLDALGQELE